jgi:cell division transport system permease protein
MNRVFTTAGKHLRRSPYQVLAAVLTLTLTFFAVSVFSLLMTGSYFILRFFEAAPQVIAFFEKGKDIDDLTQNAIHQRLEASGKLATFRYVSTREAEAIYKEKNKDDPLLLELVDYKILPPSIEISATEIASLPQLKDILESEPLVQDVVFYEDIVNTLSAWVRNLRLLGVGIITFLLLLSVLIITLIVGMKVKAKKMEIEILRLLGGSNWFIQGPFLIEGIFYGTIGALLGWLGAYILLLYTTPFLLTWLADMNLLPVSPLVMLGLLGFELVLGAFVGMLSSTLAVKRFLRI